jgi:polar amino acid transport system substrate-binding protein
MPLSRERAARVRPDICTRLMDSHPVDRHSSPRDKPGGTSMRLIMALLLAGLLIPAARAQESLLDTVLKRDKIIVGTYSTSPPMAYVDDKGDLVGFEIDLAHQLAKDLLGDPNKLEFVVLQSDGRFPAALSGKIDVGMCTTTITPDRAVRIAFTRPYIDTGNSLVVRKDAGIKTIRELNDPKFTYAILNVPPAIDRAKLVLPNVKLLLLDSPSALFLAVKTGRATAFNIDKPIADYYEHENDDLTRLDVTGSPFAYVQNDSFFLKPGDFKWWLFLDTFVGELRYGSRYAQYVEWYQKWLHKDPPPQRYYDFNKY